MSPSQTGTERATLLLDTAAQAPAAPRWLATRAPWVIGLVGRLLELLPAERRALLHNEWSHSNHFTAAGRRITGR